MENDDDDNGVVGQLGGFNDAIGNMSEYDQEGIEDDFLNQMDKPKKSL